MHSVDKPKPPAKSTSERTVRVQPPSLRSENRPWCLVVVVGGNLIGSRFELDDAATLGREPSADIHLPEPSISRHHCHIFRKRGGYWVTDLGATNPTRVNGNQVDTGPLLEGDMLTVGDLVLKLLGPNSPENALVAILREQATRDPLTGLANRRHFHTNLSRQFEAATRNRKLALIVLDIDHFKRINDRHGHAAGDATLKAVGAVLSRHLRKTDLAGRIGGEEFAALLPHTEPEEAREVAERLRRALEALQPDIGGASIAVAASFGVAVGSPADAHADALYARADAALYEAKRSGRNQVLLAPMPAADEAPEVAPDSE
jgi:diguanylate cyclase (GGDEF)-like protein